MNKKEIVERFEGKVLAFTLYQNGPGPNHMTLTDAKINFENIGAVNLDMVKNVISAEDRDKIFVKSE